MKAVLGAASAAALLAAAAPARAADEAQGANGQPAEKHHSKAKGAAVGAVGGAAVGGKKGAAVGAVGGTAVQHHKNKKAAKKADKNAQSG
jgi:hypothetical protein